MNQTGTSERVVVAHDDDPAPNPRIELERQPIRATRVESVRYQTFC